QRKSTPTDAPLLRQPKKQAPEGACFFTRKRFISTSDLKCSGVYFGMQLNTSPRMQTSPFVGAKMSICACTRFHGTCTRGRSCLLSELGKTTRAGEDGATGDFSRFATPNDGWLLTGAAQSGPASRDRSLARRHGLLTELGDLVRIHRNLDSARSDNGCDTCMGFHPPAQPETD
ncbi:MAG: hypothetical protein ACK4XK_10510, partial [Casimicrobiaceae bacterium]